MAELAYGHLPAGFTLETLECDEAERPLIASLRRADYVMGFTHRRWSRGEYDAAAAIRLIQLLGAGYDQIDLEEVRRIGVPVCHSGGANSTAVAEHTVLLILAVFRRLPSLDRSVRAQGWVPMGGTGFPELEGKVVGLVGIGAIGRKVARILRGFAAQLQYYDTARLPSEQEAALGLRFAPLADLLRSSDIVTLHVPLSASTRGLIGARELELMKRQAVLVNTSRGMVVDESALYEALANGTIAGAGLDVFMEEPLPAGNPLVRLDNVILTPHIAGASRESWARRVCNGFENVQRVARGEQPLWLIPELRESPAG